MAPDRVQVELVCSFLLLTLGFPFPAGLYYINSRDVLIIAIYIPLSSCFFVGLLRLLSVGAALARGG